MKVDVPESQTEGASGSRPLPSVVTPQRLEKTLVLLNEINIFSTVFTMLLYISSQLSNVAALDHWH